MQEPVHALLLSLPEGGTSLHSAAAAASLCTGSSKAGLAGVTTVGQVGEAHRPPDQKGTTSSHCFSLGVTTKESFKEN